MRLDAAPEGATVAVVPVDAMTVGSWDWSATGPSWQPHRYTNRVTFDVFPAYRHDLEVVTSTAEAVAAVCPPRWPVTIYAADREDVCRSNGYSDIWAERSTDDETLKSRHGVIFLSGKRIPPHPATTRYLVAHEYGHAVQWMLAAARGASNPQDDKILTEYAEMRGLPTPIHFGSGGRWHDSCAEVFACDFRIVVCDVETEFWPHPGIERPGPAVAEWWEAALADLRAPATVAGR